MEKSASETGQCPLPDNGSDPSGLSAALLEYSRIGLYPMHMPGHKRNAAFLKPIDPWKTDITEITGFDNLHDADGILLEGMRRASALYGSRRAFYLVNGSTCGILAAVRACTRRGDTVIVARNCHQAVYHALELCGLTPVYLLPETDGAFGISGSVTPQSLMKALLVHPGARLVILTSPTYDGVISDIASLASLAHDFGIPLLVDEAHGSHLGFSPAFPKGAVSLGADLVIQSLHKTLPCLTQTALLHVCGVRVDDREAARQLSIFETSSPSYLFMAAMDDCIHLMQTRGSELMDAYAGRLSRFDRSIAHLRRLRVLCHGEDALSGHPALYSFDPGKILISAARTPFSGKELFQTMERTYRIEPEMAYGDCVLAMTSLCDTDEGFDRLIHALSDLDRRCEGKPGAMHPEPLSLPEREMLPCEALESPSDTVSFAESCGCVSQEYVSCYPPGIPLLVPGERIDLPLIDAVSQLARQGAAVKSTCGQMPGWIRIVKSEQVKRDI